MIKWYHALSVVLFIVFVIMLLTRIFGHSATDVALVVGGFSTLGSCIYGLNREVGEIKTSMRHSFEKIKEDFREVNSRLDKLLETKAKSRS